MATQHSPAFLALVDDARRRIREIPANELPRHLQRNAAIQLLDVREQSEFDAGHVQGAVWLGKGILERDVETRYPDKTTPLYLYCGGGFRSALAADSLLLPHSSCPPAETPRPALHGSHPQERGRTCLPHLAL